MRSVAGVEESTDGQGDDLVDAPILLEGERAQELVLTSREAHREGLSMFRPI